jgi:hypothetical protein
MKGLALAIDGILERVPHSSSNCHPRGGGLGAGGLSYCATPWGLGLFDRPSIGLKPPALEFSPEIDGEWWVPGADRLPLSNILLRTPHNCVPKDTVPIEVPHCLRSR